MNDTPFAIPVAHSHDLWLVIVSVAIAMLASYTALELTGRVTAMRGSGRFNWLIAGAGIMGSGIWSMHFTAMLAFQIPLPIAYNIPTVIVSWLVAVIASGLALYTASLPYVNKTRLGLSGVLMGFGIAAMHYIGMAAMRLQAEVTYDSFYFSLSIFIAIVASVVALWLFIQFRNDSLAVWSWQKGFSAVIMGLAISGMHFTGMHAAIVIPVPDLAVNISQAIDISFLGAIAIAIITIMMLGFALVFSIVDRRLALQASVLSDNLISLQETQQRATELEKLAKLDVNLSIATDEAGIVAAVGISLADNECRVSLSYFEMDENDVPVRSKTMVVWANGAIDPDDPTLHTAYNLDEFPITKLWLHQGEKFVTVSDFEDDPLVDENLASVGRQFGLRAIVLIPLRSGGRWQGILVLTWGTPRLFTADEQFIFQRLYDTMGAIVAGRRAYLKQQEALVEVVATQRRYTVQTWDYYQAKQPIQGYERTRNGARELRDPLETQHLDTNLSTSLTTAEPNGHQLQGNGRALLEVEKSSLTIPLKVRGQVIGVLGLEEFDPTRQWTPEEIALVEVIAEQFAQAAENIRLLDDIQRQAARERLTRQITDKLRASRDIQTALQIAARELNQALGASKAVIDLALEPQPEPEPEVAKEIAAVEQSEKAQVISSN